jgi:2Fe-2S ferredoxin
MPQIIFLPHAVLCPEGLVDEADELEEDLLDRAWGLEAQSRLSCQALVGDEELTVEIPQYSLNHAAEAPH